MQAQQHVFRPTQDFDVARYRPKDTSATSPPQRGLSETYIPKELLISTKAEKKTAERRAARKRLSLKELEERERKRKQVQSDAEGTDYNAQDNDREEEEVADYTMNYYESEGDESDAGGDGEPTF